MVKGRRSGRKERAETFFFNDTATTEIYTLSLHDALPIYIAINANITSTGSGDITIIADDAGIPADSGMPA